MSGRTMVAVFVAALLGLGASVCNSKQPPESSPKKGPPPEAYEACEGKAEGDACKMEGKRGKMEGRCVKGPEASEEERLSCAPKNRKGPPPQGAMGKGPRDHGPPHGKSQGSSTQEDK